MTRYTFSKIGLSALATVAVLAASPAFAQATAPVEGEKKGDVIVPPPTKPDGSVVVPPAARMDPGIQTPKPPEQGMEDGKDKLTPTPKKEGEG